MNLFFDDFFLLCKIEFTQNEENTNLKALVMVYFPSLSCSNFAALEGSLSRFLRRDPVVKGMMR